MKVDESQNHTDMDFLIQWVLGGFGLREWKKKLETSIGFRVLVCIVGWLDRGRYGDPFLRNALSRMTFYIQAQQLAMLILCVSVSS